MNPDQTPQQTPQEPSVQDWFKDLPSDPTIPQPVVPVATPIEEPKKSGSKKPLAIISIVAALTLLLSSGGFAYWYFTTDTCLTANDYKNFTGQTADSQQSFASNFYITTPEFDDQWGKPIDSSKAEIKKMAKFYNEHSNTSVIFTIASDYANDSQKELKLQHSKAVKDYLSSLGVEADDIKMSEPSKINSDGEVNEDELPSLAATYLTISSADTCR